MLKLTSVPSDTVVQIAPDTLACAEGAAKAVTARPSVDSTDDEMSFI
jgi:hypothetical protein